jgi:anti-sigma factor RsiW
MPSESRRRHLTQERLNELLEGRLAADDRRRAEAHLAECRTCSGRARRLKPAFDALRLLPDHPLSRDLAPTILARIPQRGTPPPLRWALALQLAAAAVLAVWTGADSWVGWWTNLAIQWRAPVTAIVESLQWPRSGWEFLLEEARRTASLGPQWLAQPPSLPTDFEQLTAAPLVLAAAAAVWLGANTFLLPARPRGGRGIRR